MINNLIPFKSAFDGSKNKFEHHDICHNIPITCLQNIHNMSHSILSRAILKFFASKASKPSSTLYGLRENPQRYFKCIRTRILNSSRIMLLKVYIYIYMIIQEESLCRDKLSPSIMIFILDTYKIQTESPLLPMPTFLFFAISIILSRNTTRDNLFYKSLLTISFCR